MKEANANLHIRLKKVREYRELTQDQVIQILRRYGYQIDISTLSKWECGKRKPNLLDLFWLATAYNMSFDEIFFPDLMSKRAIGHVYFNNRESRNAIHA